MPFKKKTVKEFIEKANKIHNNKYDYDKVIYTGQNDKVCIICPKHGEFWQSPKTHYKANCPNCRYKASELEIEEFFNKCQEIHNKKYDYSLSKYENFTTKMTIICPIHGEFEQIPASHKNGEGCPKCGRIKTGQARRLEYGKLLEEFKILYDDKYEYYGIEYFPKRTYILAGCKIHGKFSKDLNKHRKGKGCPQCMQKQGLEKRRESDLNAWKHSDWAKIGEKSRLFESFKVYILECWNENERFFKIGKTFQKISRRYSGNINYNWKVLKIITSDDGIKISKLEIELKQAHKKYKYLPKIKFGGMYECFSEINEEYLK